MQNETGLKGKIKTAINRRAYVHFASVRQFFFVISLILKTLSRGNETFLPSKYRSSCNSQYIVWFSSGLGEERRFSIYVTRYIFIQAST